MPTRDGYPEGIPSWVDLGTTDVDRAKSFYGAVFGWEYRDEDGPTPYFTALRRGLPAAGIGLLQNPQGASSWTSYFASDDADRTAKRVGEAGGAIVLGPDDIGESGRLVVATDPTGAAFGIWQAGEHFGAAIVNEHGALNWNELITDDVAAATSFYEFVLGFASETEDLGEGHPYTTFKVGDRVVAGAAGKRNPEVPNHWNAYFAVADADTAVEQAIAGGGEVLREAIKTDGVGTIARLSDPLGATFCIIELDLEID